MKENSIEIPKEVSITDTIPVTKYSGDETLRTLHPTLRLIKVEEVVKWMQRYLADELSLWDLSETELKKETVERDWRTFKFALSSKELGEVVWPEARTAMIEFTVSLKEVLEI